MEKYLLKIKNQLIKEEIGSLKRYDSGISDEDLKKMAIKVYNDEIKNYSLMMNPSWLNYQFQDDENYEEDFLYRISNKEYHIVRMLYRRTLYERSLIKIKKKYEKSLRDGYNPNYDYVNNEWK